MRILCQTAYHKLNKWKRYALMNIMYRKFIAAKSWQQKYRILSYDTLETNIKYIFNTKV